MNCNKSVTLLSAVLTLTSFGSLSNESPTFLATTPSATQSTLFASDGSANDRFGYSVATGANGQVILGAYKNDDGNGTESGSVYVYNKNNLGGYDELKLTASDGAAYDYFGFTVAAGNNGEVIVGAFGDDDAGSRSGSVYVFTPDGNGGYAEQKLTAQDAAEGDYFGYALAAGDNGEIVVGAYLDDVDGLENLGSVYVFTPTANGDYDQQKLLANDGVAGDAFGFSVAIGNDGQIAAGARSHDNFAYSGSVYVYTPNEDGGYQQQKLLASDAALNDYLGYSVAVGVNGEILAGAPGSDDNGDDAGSIYIFRPDETGNYSETKLNADAGSEFDYVGVSVTAGVNGEVIFGAVGEDSGSGSVYVLSLNDEGNYSQQKFIASDVQVGDSFGFAIAQNTLGELIVSAYGKDNLGNSAGGAYVLGSDYFNLSISHEHLEGEELGAFYSPYDADGDELTFTISGTDQSQFTVSDEGLIAFNAVPDFEAPSDSNGDNVYELTLSASDGVVASPINIYLTVTDSPDTDADELEDVFDTDDDNDGVDDVNDAFPLDATESSDMDGDGIGDNADTDRDGDGVANDSDAFASDYRISVDSDNDGLANDFHDSCDQTCQSTSGLSIDSDDDGDGYSDSDETIAGTSTIDATDTPADNDNDFIPDVIDDDDDNDGIADSDDLFVFDSTEWADLDGDGIGDNSDSDRDGDNVENDSDAFADDFRISADHDNDGLANQYTELCDSTCQQESGLTIDEDDDNDGVADSLDVFPLDISEWADLDGDGTGDNADTDRDGDDVLNTEDVFDTDASEWADLDGDGIGDNADTDRDGDGVLNTDDVFDTDINEWADLDGDGTGDNADTDRDGDGVLNTDDVFDTDINEWADLDGDGTGDNADTDRDGDGVLNTDDVFDTDVNEWADLDGDGTGDNADTDRDGDGVLNTEDAFDTDASEWADLDGDGTGDNSDLDIDGDGVANDNDAEPLVAIDPELDVNRNGIDDSLEPEAQLLAVAKALTESVIVLNATGVETDITAHVDDEINRILTQLALSGVSLIGISNDGLLLSGTQSASIELASDAGFTTTVDIDLIVNPLVSTQPSRFVTAGKDLVIELSLSGEAANYPIAVNYQLDYAGGEQTTGVVEFDVDQQSAEFVVESVIAGVHTLILNNTEHGNAAVDLARNVTNINSLTNTAPVISAQLFADDIPVTLFDVTSSNAALELTITDAQLEDEHSMLVTINDAEIFNDLTSGNEQLILSPAALGVGQHSVEIIASELNTLDLLSVTKTFNIVIAETLVELESTNDTDGDGISDEEEGYSDSDGDGIADYLDDVSLAANELQLGEGIVQVPEGLSISIGETLKTVDEGLSEDISIDVVEIEQALGIEVDDTDLTEFVSPILDFEISGAEIGSVVDIVIPLPTPISGKVEYRKLQSDGTLVVFDESDGSVIRSAASVNDSCPEVESYDDLVWLPGLIEGNDCIKLSIVDGGVNDEDGLPNGVIVDPGVIVRVNSVPAIEITSSLMANEGSEVNIVASISDPDGDDVSVTWVINNDDNIVLTNADSSTVSFTAPDVTENETINLTVTADDGRDSVTQDVALTVNFVNQAPIISNLAHLDVSEGQSINLSPTVTDPDLQIMSYQWTQTSGLDLSLSETDMASLSFVAPQVDQQTDVTLKFEVSDGLTTVEQQVTVSISNLNTAPLLIKNDIEATTEGTEFTLQVNATDAENDQLVYQWSQLSGIEADIIQSASNTLTVRAPEVTEQQILVFEVSVSDGEFSQSEEFEVVVNNVNQAPVLTVSVDKNSVDEGESLTLTVEGSDQDGDDLSVTIKQTSGSQSIDLTTVDLPSSTDIVAPQVNNNEVYSFEITVSDGQTQVVKTVSFSVNNKLETVTQPEPESTSSSGGSIPVTTMLLFVLVLIRRIRS